MNKLTINWKITAIIGAVLLVGAMLVAWLMGRMTIVPAYLGESAYASTLSTRTVEQIAEGIGNVTRLKLTPDGQLMFVTSLDGTVRVLVWDGFTFNLQATPVYKISTGFRPAEENGMTGLIISQNFSVNKSIFVTYAERQGGVGRNRILRLTIEQQDGNYVGVSPKTIFTGNTVASGAHQIQGGASLIIEGQPHILFAVGDGYRSTDAQDLTKEAGKFMLITEDGGDPWGARPFPQFPKIQAIGIRNVYDLSIDPTRALWVYFTQNGDTANDTITYAPLLDGNRQLNFNWDGRDENLLTPIENGEPKPEYIIYHWPVTVAPTDIVADNLGRFYFNIFSSVRKPAKELVMGKINPTGQVELQTVAIRREEVTGGNLLGLALAGNGSLYFGDFFDGMIYRFGRL